MREDWTEVEVSQLGQVITGGTPSKKNGDYYSSNDYPFYKPTDLNKGYFVKDSIDSLSVLGFQNSRSADAGSVLVTCIGATIGKTGLIKNEGAFNQQINAITPRKITLSEYLYFQIIAPVFQKQIKSNASSTTLPILNKGKFSKLPIQLAPLPEQRAIVAKIEALFSEVDQGIADLKKAQDQLKVYRQAVLKKAFEGYPPDQLHPLIFQLAEAGGKRLRYVEISGKEFKKSVHRMIRYFCEYGSEPSHGFDALHFAGTCKGVKHGGALRSFVRSGKEVVLSSQRVGSD